MTANKEDIGYAWNFVGELGNVKQFSISGNFAKGTTAEEMNAEVDKINSVVNRQQARAAMVGAKQEIDQRIAQKQSAEEDFARLDEEAKGEHQSAAERERRKTAKVHIEKLGKDIEYKQGVLAKLENEAK